MSESRIIALAPSSRNKALRYEIRENEAGVLSCACDGFRWRGKCGHLKKYADGGLPPYREGDEVELIARVTFKSDDPKFQGPITVTGLPIKVASLKVGDVTDGIEAAEGALSRLTGLTVRIETDAE